MVEAEVLLDRLDLSPGVIDGKAGECREGDRRVPALPCSRRKRQAGSGDLEQATRIYKRAGPGRIHSYGG
jgi:hypothetical protein